MRRLCFILVSLALLCFTAKAQNMTITGEILDAGTKDAIIGVSIVVKGSPTQGTVSDVNGKYSLTVPAGSTLIFSYIGYQPHEENIQNRTVVNILLREATELLEEVVVVGYGTMRKSDVTGAIASVKTQELNAYPTTNVLQALSGRAPGVQVIQNTGAPGAAISVRVRGANSIQGSNEPLYVVDGFPISGSNPTILNNNDIESIEILKDASATAIYGSRGANGVVLISTKKGNSGRTRVEFESGISIQTLRKKLDLMDATEYANFYNEVAANDGMEPRFTQEEIKLMGKGFDWQDFVFQNAQLYNVNLTVSGGNDKTKFSISGGLFEQEGIIKNSGYKRYSFRTNIDHKINNKFSVSANVALSKIKNEAQNNSGGDRGGSLISGTVSAYPTLTPYNDDGTYRNLSIAYPWGSNALRNPINYINEQSNITKANKVLGNVAFTYNPIPELTVKILGGIENSDDRNDTYTTTKFEASQGSASVSVTQTTSLLSENTIAYDKRIGKHSLSAMAGVTYQNFKSVSLSGSGSGFLSDVTETYNLGSASSNGIPGSGYSYSVLFSYLGRLHYSYNDRYLATINFRSDGSSKFSENNKWGYFPSGALAWRISEEEFLKEINFLSNLKLRIGWGLTGSQAIAAYATLNQLSSAKTVFGDALYTSFAPSTRYPGNLKWETTEQTDLGLDFGLFDNKLQITADYYWKKTRDLLNTVPLASSTGYNSTIQNVGSIRNNGFEFSVSANLIRSEKITWNIDANIAFNKSKVLKLYGGDDVLGSAYNVTLVNDVINILREGEAVGAFYGYVEKGYDEKGKILYEDLSGDEVINEKDKTIIGDPNPDFIYGLNSNFSYRNVELSIFFQGLQGNDIFNLSSINNTIDYGFGLNMPKEVYTDHWTPSNTNAKYPAVSRSTSIRVSDRFVENGSYLRLKNIQLAYNLPVKNWGLKNVENIQIYASGQNLLTLTKYSWWDPEVNSKGGSNSVNQGIDHHTYPTAKSVTFGLRVGF